MRDAVLGRIRRAVASSIFRHRSKEGGLGFPCAVCGRPASSWAYEVSELDGTQMVDGQPVCVDHVGGAEMVHPGQAADGDRAR